MKKKINIAIILARGGSKGILNKNLKNLNGKPLLYWSIHQCLRCKEISSVWVSSDSKEIIKVSKKFGANTITRPKNISKDNSTSESGWIHAINYFDKKKINLDTIVALQATSPLRESKDIKKALAYFYLKKIDSLFTGSINNEIFFNWTKISSKIIPNYNIRIRTRRQNLKNSILENGSFYIFDKKKFKKNKNRLFGKVGVYLMSKIKSFQLDDSNDFEIIKSIMNNKKIKKNLNKFM